MISKILSLPILSSFIEQNIFLPENYNAFTISEPDFTLRDEPYIQLRSYETAAWPVYL